MKKQEEKQKRRSFFGKKADGSFSCEGTSKGRFFVFRKYRKEIRRNLIALLTAAAVVLAFFAAGKLPMSDRELETVHIGFVHVGDGAAPYTYNFMKVRENLEKTYGSQVLISERFNVAEGDEKQALQSLVEAGCDLIFGTSYNYGVTVKEFAALYPDIEFCQATCSNANEEPVLPNYHNFMGEIYQGRYAAGIAAGMKLKELTDSHTITAEEAKIGYVAAYPYAEVISGYTAFLLGVRSVVPQAQMTVTYTNTWNNYSLEKEAAGRLIERGCVIISQHSDTIGPAMACENAESSHPVYHIGYNRNMSDVAPMTHILSSRINWEPYIMAAAEAVRLGKPIEKNIEGKVCGNDAFAGFQYDWVELTDLNEIAAAPGTKERLDNIVEEFIQGNVQVFQGNYTGTNPFDETDTIDLREGYIENREQSAPSFCYVLDDIEIID